MASSSARLKRILGDWVSRDEPTKRSTLASEAALQLGLEPGEQVLLQALLDHQEVLLGDEPAVPRRRQDDEERVAEAGDGDEVLAADQLAARLLQALADDPVHVVDDLEPLQLLERLHAVRG